jgi:hypothetical protein
MGRKIEKLEIQLEHGQFPTSLQKRRRGKNIKSQLPFVGHFNLLQNEIFS